MFDQESACPVSMRTRVLSLETKEKSQALWCKLFMDLWGGKDRRILPA